MHCIAIYLKYAGMPVETSIMDKPNWQSLISEWFWHIVTYLNYHTISFSYRCLVPAEYPYRENEIDIAVDQIHVKKINLNHLWNTNLRWECFVWRNIRAKVTFLISKALQHACILSKIVMFSLPWTTYSGIWKKSTGNNGR